MRFPLILYKSYRYHTNCLIRTSHQHLSHHSTYHHSFIEYDSSDSETEEDPIQDITQLELTNDEVINKNNFEEEWFVQPTTHFNDSVINDDMDTEPIDQTVHDTNMLNRYYRRQARFTFATILDIIQGAIGGFMNHETITNDQETNEESHEITIHGVAKQLALNHNKILDKKQYITYEIICCSFLLSILNDSTDCETNLYQQIDRASNSNAGNIIFTTNCINSIQIV